MRFVIIASKRTGSSHLVNMVGTHIANPFVTEIHSTHEECVEFFWPEKLISRAMSEPELQNLRRDKSPWTAGTHFFNLLWATPCWFQDIQRPMR